MSATERTDHGSGDHEGKAFCGYAIKWEEGKRGARKMVLPKPPKPDDILGHCAWLTVAYNLDYQHPINEARWFGPRGSKGIVVLKRKDAPDLRFEPAGAMYTPGRMIAELGGHKIPTDHGTLGYSQAHCSQIADVVGMLARRTADAEQASTTWGAVYAYLDAAIPQTDCTTYGDTRERFKAAGALAGMTYDETRRQHIPHYLVDARTGHRADPETGEVIDQDQLPEYVLPVEGFLGAARKYTGDVLSVGTLNAWVEEIGWERITIQGYRSTGRAARSEPGGHRRVYGYRGRLEDTREDAPE